ncbi:MAG: hypothetical protein GBAus27B_000055 [Mycoplasmataceae bacterium]|nr:MAG: hypothetical protein GBAus27B_000055 [Mycoplasmataceae bacterium]
MNLISKTKKKKKPFDYLRYRIEIVDRNKTSSAQKITNMNFNEPTKTFRATINTKEIRQGKNGKDYLLLRLDNQEVIFVFHSKDTPESTWIDLTEGEEYTFTVKEGLNESNILVSFELDL